jgi:hypothetical protein
VTLRASAINFIGHASASPADADDALIEQPIIFLDGGAPA